LDIQLKLRSAGPGAKRHATKKASRPVDIYRLNDIVHIIKEGVFGGTSQVEPPAAISPRA
jgi:hypothetical protein